MKSKKDLIKKIAALYVRAAKWVAKMPAEVKNFHGDIEQAPAQYVKMLNEIPELKAKFDAVENDAQLVEFRAAVQKRLEELGASDMNTKITDHLKALEDGMETLKDGLYAADKAIAYAGKPNSVTDSSVAHKTLQKFLVLHPELVREIAEISQGFKDAHRVVLVMDISHGEGKSKAPADKKPEENGSSLMIKFTFESPEEAQRFVADHDPIDPAIEGNTVLTSSGESDEVSAKAVADQMADAFAEGYSLIDESISLKPGKKPTVEIVAPSAEKAPAGNAKAPAAPPAEAPKPGAAPRLRAPASSISDSAWIRTAKDDVNEFVAILESLNELIASASANAGELAAEANELASAVEEMPAEEAEAPAEVPAEAPAEMEAAPAALQPGLTAEAKAFPSEHDQSGNFLEIVEADGQKKLIIKKDVKSKIGRKVAEHFAGVFSMNEPVVVDMGDSMSEGVISGYQGDGIYSVAMDDGRNLRVPRANLFGARSARNLWGE